MEDFNTAKAIGVIFDAVKEANRLQKKRDTVEQAMALRGEIVRLGQILGLLADDPHEYFHRVPGEGDVEGLLGRNNKPVT